MEIIKKRLKGLCALITAAAMSLSALAVPAMASDSGSANAIDVYVTTEAKKAAGEAYSKIELVGNTTDTLKDVFEKAAEDLDEFHEPDTSKYSVAGAEISTKKVIDYLDQSEIKPYEENEDAELGGMLNYHNEIRALIGASNFDYTNHCALFVVSAKAKSFTLPVYDADGNKVFEFTTDCDSKYFPTDELKRNFSCALDIEYKHDSVNILSAGCTGGDKLWEKLEQASSKEKLNSNKFDPQYLKLTIKYPSYTLTKIDLSYSDGFQKGYTQENPDFYEIVTGKNDYFNSRLTDNDFWAVKTGGYSGDGPRQEKVETIKGSDLISALITKSTTLNSITGTLTHMGKIAVCNTISGDPNSPDNSAFYKISNFNFNFSNMTEYTIDNMPVTAYELAREAGIKPSDADYNAALYTPSSWTVWGGGFNYTSGYVATNTKVNGKFEDKDDFDFNNHGGIDLFNLPILQVHEMKLLEVEIPCDDATGGKLTYTAADHSDFPNKANAKSWAFTYDGKSVEVKNADELWAQIEKIIVTDGKIYDSSLAKLVDSTCSAGHTWSKTYKSDKNGHWKICEVCNAVSKTEAHTPGKPSADHKQNCTVCGYLIKTVPHSYGTAWKSNSTSHWHECSCGDKTDIEKHTSDNGTVTVQPTATSAGTMTYSCKVCGYVIKTTVIPATGTPGYPNRPSYPTNTPSTPTADTTKAMFTFDWNIQGKKAVLSWNDIPDAESYTVYRYKNGKYVKIKTTEKTSVTLKNLKNGETYKFMVKYTIKGKTYSAGASGKFTGKFYYKPIAEATAGKNRIKLTWEKVSGAEKYAIYKYVNGKAVKLAETTKLSVNIKGLKSDKEYQYIVRAYVDGKWTDMKKSDIVTAKTKA